MHDRIRLCPILFARNLVLSPRRLGFAHRGQGSLLCARTLISGCPRHPSVPAVRKRSNDGDCSSIPSCGTIFGRGPLIYRYDWAFRPRKKAILNKWEAGANAIDPVVSYLVGATSGHGYKNLIGQVMTYPIPSIPLLTEMAECSSMLDRAGVAGRLGRTQGLASYRDRSLARRPSSSQTRVRERRS